MKEILIRIKFNPESSTQPSDVELDGLKINLKALLQEKLNKTIWETEVD